MTDKDSARNGAKQTRARTSAAGWSAILATWISIFGAFGGGFMALAKYGEEVEKMEDGKVVQTFALFEMFNSSERLQSRQRIFDYMKSGGDMNANDLYVFVDFYDALQVCVDRELCDQDLSVRLFQSYAVPVWDEFKDQLIGGRTESDPHFGGGLEWMASLPVPTKLADGPDPTAPAADPQTIEPDAMEISPEAPPAAAGETAPAIEPTETSTP